MIFFKRLRKKKQPPEGFYSFEQVKTMVAEALNIGYNDGKRAGIEISKQAATKVIKEALWQENSLNEKRK